MKDDKKINFLKLNDMLNVGNKVVKILYVLFIILLIYVVSLIFKDWKILGFIGKILSIISPLFIGWFIAWLLNPLVNKMCDKGIKKTLSVILAYLFLLAIITLILVFTIPSLGTQVSDIVNSIPKIVSDLKEWINNIFLKLSCLNSDNLETVRTSFILKLETMASGIETNLPETAVNLVSSLANGIGVILLSLLLGFYILFDFDKFTKTFIELFPKNARKDVSYLLSKLNESLYSFVSGTLWLSLLLFVISVIGFSIIGLNAPVMIALICVITNLIPYIGPYIGAAVAGLIGFAESPLIGILTLIFILIVQTIEGNILQPLIMSKKLNLSPITIIISLLIFNYLFGIIGMVIATPAVALLKIIYVFFDEKYNFFEFKDKQKNDSN